MNADSKQDIVRVIEYINKLDKLKLNNFLVDILDLKENASIYSEFHFVQEFNNFLVEKQLIQKENQINFCIFFSYLTKNLEETNPFIEILNQEIYLKGNKEKINFISNISSNNKKDKKYKVDIKNLFLVEKNTTIQTSFLNKKKFNTIKFLTHVLANYRYEFKLTKTTVKNLLYIFYIFRVRMKNDIPKIDKDICDYIEKMIDFLEVNYNILK